MLLPFVFAVVLACSVAVQAQEGNVPLAVTQGAAISRVTFGNAYVTGSALMSKGRTASWTALQELLAAAAREVVVLDPLPLTDDEQRLLADMKTTVRLCRMTTNVPPNAWNWERALRSAVFEQAARYWSNVEASLKAGEYVQTEAFRKGQSSRR